jgi:hypothetical protein
MKEKQSDKFNADEVQRRFEAALRGARIAGPKHKKSVTPKRRGPQHRLVKKGAKK